METIKIVDYADRVGDTKVAVEDVESIFVEVISGDEILHLHLKDGSNLKFDALSITDPKGYRLMNFHDGSYFVDMNRVYEWNKITDSYDRFDYDDSGEN